MGAAVVATDCSRACTTRLHTVMSGIAGIADHAFNRRDAADRHGDRARAAR